MHYILLILWLCPGYLFSQANQTNTVGVTWHLNEEALYSVQFSTTVKTSLAAFAGSGKDTSINGSLKGRMRIHCIESNDQRQTLYARFDTGLQAVFPLPVKELRTMQENLLQGFHFIQLNNGLIDSVFIPATFSDAAEHVAVQLLEYFQLYRPSSGEKHWQMQIETSDGSLVANYSLEKSTGGDNYIHLTSLTPLQENTPGLVLSRYNWYDADMKYYFTKNDVIPHRIEGQINRRSGINHKTLLRELNNFQFVLLPAKTSQSNSPGRDLTKSKGRPLYYPGKIVERAREKILQRSQSIHILPIIQQLQENEIAKDENQQDKLAENIRVCFQASKDSLSLIRDIFLKADINGFSFKTIRTALITAATEFSQQIIAEFLDTNTNDWNKLKRIIPSAGLIHNPSYAIQRKLENFAHDKDISEPIRSSSQLALGNMAGSLRYTNSVRADSIAWELASFFKASDDPVLFLSVVGNCGTNNIIPVVMPFLSDTNAEIRSYAYYALRFMDKPMVDSLFEQGLQKEKEAGTLVNIFNALHFRKYDSSHLGSLLKIVATDSSQEIRLGALEVIFEWSYRQLSLLKPIKNVADENSNAAIRAKAKDFLGKVDE